MSNLPIISIVDDDHLSLRATARLVRSLGYPVAAFASAEEFLSSDRLDETACVISDVQMPGMSGLDLQVRLLARGSRLPIIFITAYSNIKIRDQALAMGALGFLDKTMGEDQLISFLDRALSAGKG